MLSYNNGSKYYLQEIHRAFTIRHMNKNKILSYNIYFIIFLDSLGAGIIFPVLPDLFFNHSFGFTFNHSTNEIYMYTLTLLCYPLMQIFGIPFLSNLSDKYGRKKILLLGLGVMGISYILAFISVIIHCFPLFLFYRILLGFFSGTSSIGNAMLSDLNSSEIDKKFTAFSMSSIFDKLGLTFGPVLSIFAVKNPLFSNILAVPFFLTAFFIFLNLASASYCFRNTFEQKKNIEPIKPSFRSLLTTTIQAIQMKKIRWLVISLCLFQIGNSLFFQAIPLYLTIYFQYTPEQLGFTSLIMSTIIVLSTLTLTKALSAYSKNNIKKIKLLFICIIIVFFIASFNLHITDKRYFEEINRLWLAISLFYFFSPCIKILFTSLFSQHVSQEKQGWVMGIIGQVNAISLFISMLFVAFLTLNHIVILTLTCILLLSFLMLRKFLLQKKQKKSSIP